MLNFERTVEILIGHKFAETLVDQLQGETEEFIKQNTEGVKADSPKKSRYQRVDKLIFGKEARKMFILALIIQSIVVEEYHIAYETLKAFNRDVVKYTPPPSFVSLFEKMKNTLRYEAKVAVAMEACPLMSKREAFELMRIIIEIIDEPASNSILRNNINPLRVSLMVYRLISEIKDTHQYSAHTSKVVCDKLSDQIVIMLDTQIDPK